MGKVVPDDAFVTIELLAGEEFWVATPITSVTFCKGDAAAAYAALRSRLQDVLKLNPWLAGRFDKKTRIVHPRCGKAAAALVDQILSTELCAAVAPGTPYEALAVACGALSAQSAAQMRKDPKALLCKVVVVPSVEAPGDFALVFSLNHGAGDGATYYSLYNMVAGSRTAEALTATRAMEFEQPVDAEGKPKAKGYASRAGISESDFRYTPSFTFIKHLIREAFANKKGVQVNAFFIDPKKVSAAKAQAMSDKPVDVDFLSSNDVVTSHFLRASRARLAMLAIDCRVQGRLPHARLTDAHAGNYMADLILDPPNYKHPAAIRKALNAGAPFARQLPSPPLPGICGSCPLAVISNWASFPFDLALDGITSYSLHLPIIAPMADGTLSGYPAEFAVCFRPSPGRLGMLYIAKRASRAALTGSDSPLGETISDVIFAAP